MDGSDLYTLATRLLPRQTRPGAPGAQQLELYAGQLPPALPVELPLPPGARMIGTVVEGPFLTVLLDTDLSPEDALTFYREGLTGEGWAMLDTGRLRGGFEFANHSHGIFCRTPQGPKLVLNAHAYPETLTEVRLHLDLSPGTPCEYPAPRHPPGGPIPSLPELAPPADATLEPMGGEASPLGTSAQAQLTTSLDLGTVASRYAEQMRQAGCAERDRGQGQEVAWSTWELDHPDHGPSQGLVLVMQQPGSPSRYFLYLRVAWSRGDEPPAGAEPGGPAP